MEFSKEHIKFHVPGKTKEDILHYIAVSATDMGISEQVEGLQIDLEKRENEFSTGLQDGFAIPHARSKHIVKTSILFLKTEKAIEWGSMDDQNVQYIFCLLVPEQNEGNVHLMMLSRLATCLLEDDFKTFVTTCEDVEELRDYIYKGMEES